MTRSNSIKGRGTTNRVGARYLSTTRVEVDDGWLQPEADVKVRTTVITEKPRTIISRNNSPDIPFTISINPYRGCEHGCIYCYARPTHAYMDLSPGIDFETKLFAKPDAASLLIAELSKPDYQVSPLALGTNTDPYQPIEREWKITRQIIEVLQKHHHPMTIVTKSWLVERDINLLADMAQENLVQVFLSVTTLDKELVRKMEPRTTAPERRLQTINNLKNAGIPVGVMFAPVIPFLNDSEMETILTRATEAGVTHAGYVMLRLPHEIKDLFKEWLDIHYPLKTEHVMSMIRDIRGGKDNDPNFNSRMRGQGTYADMIAQRFSKTCHKLGLNSEKVKLNTDLFSKPAKTTQMDLF